MKFSGFISVWRDRSVLLLGVLLVSFVGGAGAAFHVRGESLMQQELRTRMRTIATVAALQFKADDITQITSAKDVQKPVFESLVSQLQGIRHADQDVRFAYIMRKTSDPLTLEFVADADSLASAEELDENGNGDVDEDEEASFPGDAYDIRDVPALQEQAFVQPAADEEITYDQWGALISGYAPIRDAQGRTVAVLGIDMDATRYLSLSQNVLSPSIYLLMLMGAAVVAMCVIAFLWRRKLESFRELDQERSGLLRLAYHQMGQPITILRWTTEVIADYAKEKMDQLLRKNVDDLEDALRRFSSIFAALGEADRIQAGRMDYTPQQLQLQDVIDHAAERLAPQFARRHQQLERYGAEECSVRVDPKLLSAVIEELLQNASDYSPDQTHIVVTSEKKRSFVYVSVQDKGIGIPEDDFPHVFQQFYRGSNVEVIKPGGNGLGLFIAKGIVERMGGTISITSVEGKGTTVTFSLPLNNGTSYKGGV